MTTAKLPLVGWLKKKLNWIELNWIELNWIEEEEEVEDEEEEGEDFPWQTEQPNVHIWWVTYGREPLHSQKRKHVIRELDDKLGGLSTGFVLMWRVTRPRHILRQWRNNKGTKSVWPCLVNLTNAVSCYTLWRICTLRYTLCCLNVRQCSIVQWWRFQLSCL